MATIPPTAAHGDRLDRRRAGRRLARLLAGADGGRDRGGGRRLPRGRRPRRRRPPGHEHADLPRRTRSAPRRPRRRSSRTPATGVDVRIHDEGYTVSHWGASVSVVSRGRRRRRVAAARPRRHARDGLRHRDDRRQRAARRRSSSRSRSARARRPGAGSSRRGSTPASAATAAVAFLDPTEHRVTTISHRPGPHPRRRRARTSRPRACAGGSRRASIGWWLTLELDDANLPLPYVIDPAINYPTPLNLRNTVELSDAGGWTMDSGSGVVDTTTDNIPAQNATGWYRYNPGTSQTGQLTTIPTTSTTGSGFFVDPVGGATGFPAGELELHGRDRHPQRDAHGRHGRPDGRRLRRGRSPGARGRRRRTILHATDDPAAQNLRTQVAPKTTTVTFSLPAFSIAAGETLFVDFWRHQTGGINIGTATQRQLDFYVNDGNAYITHPAADDTAPSHSLTVTELTNPGGQYFNAATATQYYNTAAGGTFRVNDAATDAGSGVASVTFPALAATGFTHTAVTDTTSPYQSNTYTWTTANTTSPGAQAVSAVDNALNSSSPSPQLTLTRDVTAPTRPDARARGRALLHLALGLADARVTAPTPARASTPPRVCTSATRPRSRTAAAVPSPALDDGRQPGRDRRLGQLLPLPLLDRRQRRQPLGHGHRLRRRQGRHHRAGGPLAHAWPRSRRSRPARLRHHPLLQAAAPTAAPSARRPPPPTASPGSPRSPSPRSPTSPAAAPTPRARTRWTTPGAPPRPPPAPRTSPPPTTPGSRAPTGPSRSRRTRPPPRGQTLALVGGP